MSTPNLTPAQAAVAVRPTVLDAAIAWFSPAAGRMRLNERRQFAYECALASRVRSNPSRDVSVKSGNMDRDRLQVMQQVRDLEENDGLVRSILNRIPLFAFGRLRRQFRTGDRSLDRVLEKRFRKWSQNCELIHGSSLRALVQLAHRCAIRDGDSFVRFHDVRRSGSRALKLELIEADAVGGNVTVTTDTKVGGVNLEGSIPVSYDLYSRAQSGAYEFVGVEPVESMLHFLDQYRAGQYRGISRLGPVVNTARDLKEIKDACKVGVKVENFGAGFITGGSGEWQGDVGSLITETSQTGTQRTVEKIEPGMMRYLPDGTSVSMVKSDRPSGQFQTYLESIVRDIGLAVNLPMGFLYSLVGLSGPGARMDSQQAARAIEEWQTLGTERVLEPIVTRWLKFEIAVNGLDLQGLSVEEASNGVWMFAPSLTIDAGRDSAAAGNELKDSRLSLQDWYAEAAKDADEELDVIADEAAGILERAKTVAQTQGVPVSRVLDLMALRVPGATPDIQIASEDAPTTQPLVAQIGVGGTQAVNEVVAQVTAGLYPREQAINYIADLTGTPKDRVATWIPDVAPKVQEMPAAPAPTGMRAELEDALRLERMAAQ